MKGPRVGKNPGDAPPRSEEETLGPRGRALLKEKKLDVPRAGEVVDIVFRNDPGDPSRYRMDIGMDLTIVLGQNLGTNKMDIKMQLDMDWLAQSASAEAQVRVPFVNQKAWMDMNMGGQDIKMVIDGKDLVATTQGQTFIDTKNGTGMAESRDIMKEMDFMGKEVTLTVDERGRQTGIKGDPALVKLFEDNGVCSEGFLPLTAPDHPVKIGIPWWEKCEMKKMGNVTMKVPIATKMRYVILGTEEKDGVETYKVRLDAPMVIKNLDAQIYLENLKKNADCLFKNMERTGGGFVWFDAKRGRIHAADLKLGIDADMVVKVQGQSLSMGMKGKVGMGLTTIPRD
jgi:hypothetical protein